MKAAAAGRLMPPRMASATSSWSMARERPRKGQSSQRAPFPPGAILAARAGFWGRFGLGAGFFPAGSPVLFPAQVRSCLAAPR